MKIPFILWMNIWNFKEVKFIYVWSKFVFESLANKIDSILDLVLYIR